MINRSIINLFCTICCVLFCGFIVYFPLTDSDIWWHLAAGREMAAHRHFMYHDPFSFTTNGASWYNLHWVFQLAVYAVFRAAGLQGLVLFKCLVFVAACLLAFFAIPARRNAFVSMTVFCLLVYGVRYQVNERPLLFSLVFIAGYIFLIERFLAGKKTGFLWALVPLQVLWTNSQGLFLLGPAIAAAYLAGGMLDGMLARHRGAANVPPLPDGRLSGGGNARLFVMLSIALLAACLVNPYGIKSFAFAARLLGCIVPSPANVYSSGISENVPLFSTLGTPGARYGVLTLLVTCTVAFSFLAGPRAVRSAHAVLAFMFLCLAIMAERNVILYFFVCAPIFSYNLAGLFDYQGIRGIISRPPVTITLAGCAAVALAAYVFSHALMLSQCPKRTLLSPFRFPTGAIAVLREHPVPGTVFNTDRYGGYLLWEFYPPERVFIDGRFTLRGPRFLGDYLAMLGDPGVHFDDACTRWGISRVIMQTSVFPVYNRLAAFLYHSPHWRLVWADGSTALFIADSLARMPRLDLGAPAEIKSIVSNLGGQWRDAPAIFREALYHLANFLRMVGEIKSAEMVVDEMP